MYTNGSPLNTANISPLGGWNGMQDSCEHNSQPSESSSRTDTGNNCHFEAQTDQHHPLHGYGYPPSQQPFEGAPEFYQHSHFNITHSLQPTTSASQGYTSYGPQWQRYALHQSGYGGSWMFPYPQNPGQGPSSPGAPSVAPGLAGNHPVNRPTSSSAHSPPEPTSSAPRIPPRMLPTKRFKPPAEPPKTNVAWIVDLPPLQDSSYDNYDADDEGDNSLNYGGPEVKLIISLE